MLRLQPIARYVLIALAIVLVDQAVKVSVKLGMAYQESIPVLGSFFQLYFIENNGAAFGLTLGRLLSPVVEISEETAKLLLSVFSVVLVFFIGRYLYSIRHSTTGLPTWVALILGGAIGNIIDRLFYGVWFMEINRYEGGLFHGRVVDMFFFDLWRFTWPNWVPGLGGTYASTPIFNIADAAISIGIVVILVFQKRFFGTSKDSEPKPAGTELEQPETPSDTRDTTIV